MKITIGMTAYNAQSTIARAIESACRQDYPDFEIVIVDDCSRDGTLAVIQEMMAAHEAIRCFQNGTNQGVAAARNKIIVEARGDFIAFFDDDDESVPNRLTRQSERVLAYEQTYAGGAPVICHSARVQIYPDGSERYEPTMGTNEGLAPHGAGVAERILTGRPAPHVFGSTATCSQMARTSLYRALGGFDVDFRRSEDTDFNIRAALTGAHFVGIKEPLVRQTMTLAADKKLGEEKIYALKLLSKHQAFIDTQSSYPFCVGWLTAKYAFLEGQKFAFACMIAHLFMRYPIETMKRFVWALPNIGFNIRLKTLHE